VAGDVSVMREVAVVVETEVVTNVEIEVVVRSLAVPTKNPTPAPASIATINIEATTPVFMPQRVAMWGV